MTYVKLGRASQHACNINDKLKIMYITNIQMTFDLSIACFQGRVPLQKRYMCHEDANGVITSFGKY